MGDDGLKILIEAALDLEKSIQNMTSDLNKLREKFKSCQIKIQAGLDKSSSATKIKNDLEQLTKDKGSISLVGEMDQTTTQKNINDTLERIKDVELKISGVLDAETIKDQLGQMPNMTAKADVDVDGAEQVDDRQSA